MIGSSKIKKQKYTVNGPCTVVTLEILIFLGFSYMPDVGDTVFCGLYSRISKKKIRNSRQNKIFLKVEYFKKNHPYKWNTR